MKLNSRALTLVCIQIQIGLCTYQNRDGLRSLGEERRIGREDFLSLSREKKQETMKNEAD